MKVKNYLPLLLVLLVACKPSQQNNTQKPTKDVIFSINGAPTYADEFLYAYNKSNSNKGTQESIEDYLDLYINFKLKVLEARKKGIDSSQVFQQELAGYLKEIKKPYLTSEQVTESLVEETYERMQKEINASHILIQVSEKASPEDTLKAYNKITELRERALNGEDFGKLAATYSEDPSARQNKGDLGWFTALQMVYPFESAAYHTALKDVSEPVRTQFGYHIIKVNERRDTQGKVKIAHIMLRHKPNGNQVDSAKVKEKAFAIYNQLLDGESWFAMCSEYSEDLNTKSRGGSLPWLGAGNLPVSLETIAYSMKETGDISKPVYSKYGWHILKLEDKRGIGSLESMRNMLEARIKRDSRSDIKISALIGQLKKENNFKPNAETYTLIKQKNTLTDTAYSAEEKKLVLFTIGEQGVFKVSEFLTASKGAKTIAQAFEDFETEKLLAYENEHLAEKYPEYRFLAQEYEEGLLLFEIMSDNVWNKAVSDTTGLKKYYQQHENTYRWKERVDAVILSFNDSSEIKEIKEQIVTAPYLLYTTEIPLVKGFSWDSAALKATKISAPLVAIEVPESVTVSDTSQFVASFISRGIPRDKISITKTSKKTITLRLLSNSANDIAKFYNSVEKSVEGKFELDEQVFDARVDFAKGMHITEKLSNEFNLIYVKERLAPSKMTYEEAKPFVISDYQSFLEEEWLDSIKQEVRISINNSVVEKLKKRVETP